MTKALQLRLLGGCSLHGDRQARPLPGAKARALLVYRCCTPAPVSRQRLAALLWGSRFEDQARQSLRQTLSKLRRALGKDVVVTEGDCVSISKSAVTADVHAFEAMVNDGAFEDLERIGLP